MSNEVYATRSANILLMLPWLPCPGRPGFYAPFPPGIPFPATRRDLVALNRQDARNLAGHLQIPGAGNMTKIAAVNAIGHAIGFVDDIV